MLHDPTVELDACGIGFVAHARGDASREIAELALAGLAGVAHRGATASDRRTGDGAGVLFPLSSALVDRRCGLAMVFARSEEARSVVEAACRSERLEPAGWRTVPIDRDALGPSALATMPRVEQLVLAPPRAGTVEAERRCFEARLRAGRAGVYCASLSFRTVTYKALCASDRLAEVYPDLRDPAMAVPFGIFHQRFSTNTSPSWERAQPFRLLAHNGEINAIRGNVNAMRARGLSEYVDESGSDSAMLDNALELLVRGGRDIRHALAMLIPEAWQGDPAIDARLRGFYAYHAALLEPWDGPAGVVFSDGRVVGAALDRNGLRPLRTTVSEDGLVTCASEAGAIPVPTVGVRRGKLGPGQMLSVDPRRGVETNAQLKRRLGRRRPYASWVTRGTAALPAGEPVPAPAEDLTARQAVFGYTREELALVIRPMAAGSHEPVSSMGDDTALPPLAGRARPLFSYFRQRFAQVTNPPIDHLRERSVMSLRTLLGARAPLLAEAPEAAELLELPSFVLYPSALEGIDAVRLDATFTEEEGLAAACRRLRVTAARAVEGGAVFLRIDDAAAGPGRAAVPSLLASACVHGRLVELGLRSRASILVVSDEPREVHHFACLIGFGADAVAPRLALETVAALAASDKLGADRPSPDEAQRRFQAAIEGGVLKVMSKMGISDIASYRGAALFDCLGLDGELVAQFFPETISGLGGLGLAELEREALDRIRTAVAERPQLENPGYVKWRKDGEPHATSGPVVAAAHALRKAVNGGGYELYERFAAQTNERPPLEPRDLLDAMPAREPVPLREVEPVEAIVRRFSSGAMSHGSLSAEAHELVAVALNSIGARANTGEGGEDRARFRDERNCAIKQVASGRFGVTPEYAVFADELQIKMAQGSKPGEGGQLPGHKVTDEIARLRHTQPGIALISPPPHHDIYSIEDLAQLIFDLRQVNPHAAISVKLVAEAGVGVIAAGCVKALADVVHVAGSDGGTGASPLSSIKSAGFPWELGLAETQQALVAEGLRARARLRVDGGLKTGRDVVLAALLGADEVAFGTALLLAEGCLMVRTCHLDSCPVGIATQRPELRAKFSATPKMVASYLLFVAEDVRRRLAALGLRSWDEAVGRVELLRRRATGDARCDALDLEPLLARAGPGPRRHEGDAMPEAGGFALGERLAADASPALTETSIVELRYPITNRDRAVGARLGGAIGRVHGEEAPPGRVRAHFEGAAGQSFGAFNAAGVELSLVGEANDYVGKAMGGGRIVVRAPEADPGGPHLLGNTVLYGATGGELYCAGRAGERFAVRNSGATAVVEGTGDHACEYMTAGTVAILGPHGRNLGAGMTGGLVYTLDMAGALVNDELVIAARLDADGAATLRALLERHVRFTGSAVAGALLADWEDAVARFHRLVPRSEAASLEAAAEGTAASP